MGTLRRSELLLQSFMTLQVTQFCLRIIRSLFLTSKQKAQVNSCISFSTFSQSLKSSIEFSMQIARNITVLTGCSTVPVRSSQSRKVCKFISLYFLKTNVLPQFFFFANFLSETSYCTQLCCMLRKYLLESLLSAVSFGM